VGSTQ